MMYRNPRVLGTALCTAMALATVGVITTAADGRDGRDGRRVRTIEMTDDCDQATFDAAVAPGTCVGDGETTFAEFIAELQRDQVAEDWAFDPDDVDVHAGQSVRARNEGGEAHSFPEVAKFGGGFIPILNDLSGNPTPAPECLAASVGATIVPAGGLSKATTITKDTQFQCCIHPWMRTVVTVEKH